MTFPLQFGDTLASGTYPRQNVSAFAARLRLFVLAALILAMPVTQEFVLGGRRVNLAAGDLALPLGVLFLAWRFFRTGARIPVPTLFCLTMASIVISLVANSLDSLAAKGPLGVIVEVVKVLFLWLLFYSGVNLIESRKDFLFALKAWIVASAIISGIGIYGSLSYQLTGIENGFALQFRAQSTMGDANIFGAYLSLSFFLTLLYRHLSGSSANWVAPFILIQLAGIFFSASRGTMLTLASTFGLFLLVSTSFRAKLIAAGAVMALSLAWLSIPDRDELLKSNPFTERLATATTDVNQEAASDRKQLWDDAWVRYAGAPLFGIGRGNFRLIGEEDPIKTGQVHNTYLGLLCETGIFGLVSYLLFFTYYPVRLLLGRATFPGGVLPVAAKLLLCSLLSLSLSGITICIENFRGLWLLMALFESYERIFGAASARPEGTA
jgi:O-antigen ligase